MSARPLPRFDGLRAQVLAHSLSGFEARSNSSPLVFTAQPTVSYFANGLRIELEEFRERFPPAQPGQVLLGLGCVKIRYFL